MAQTLFDIQAWALGLCIAGVLAAIAGELWWKFFVRWRGTVDDFVWLCRYREHRETFKPWFDREKPKGRTTSWRTEQERAAWFKDDEIRRLTWTLREVRDAKTGDEAKKIAREYLLSDDSEESADA